MKKTELESAINWANKLLNYACASNQNILIKDYSKYLGTLLDAARANQAEEMTWLPIESAPRDGTWVMGWWPNMRIDQYPCAVFYDQGVYQNPNAWSLASNLEYGEVYPTKFTPLPKPPSKIISEEKVK